MSLPNDFTKPQTFTGMRPPVYPEQDELKAPWSDAREGWLVFINFYPRIWVAICAGYAVSWSHFHFLFPFAGLGAFTGAQFGALLRTFSLFSKRPYLEKAPTLYPVDSALTIRVDELKGPRPERLTVHVDPYERSSYTIYGIRKGRHILISEAARRLLSADEMDYLLAWQICRDGWKLQLGILGAIFSAGAFYGAFPDYRYIHHSPWNHFAPLMLLGFVGALGLFILGAALWPFLVDLRALRITGNLEAASKVLDYLPFKPFSEGGSRRWFLTRFGPRVISQRER